MDKGPLVSQMIDAGARFVQEFAKAMPVQAAFWLKADEDSPWYLYLASDQITDGTWAAYGEVVRIWSTMPDPWLDPLQIKVLGASDPLAQSVIDVQSTYPSKMPSRYHGLRLGGSMMDEIFIYPLPITAAT